MINRFVKKISLVFLILFIMFECIYGQDKIKIGVDLGYDFVGIKTDRAEFSFLAPTWGLNLELNKKINFTVEYLSGEDSVIVGNSNFNFDWSQITSSLNYKIINEDKSLWVSAIYRGFQIKSSWEGLSDKDNWKGIGLGISYKPKLSENLYASFGVNYFPGLTSSIGDYSNFEISGKLQYKLKNNQNNSIILHYTNQNLSSLSDNIRDISVNQIGLKFSFIFE